MFLQRPFIGAVGIAAIVAMPLVVAAAAQWPHHAWHHGNPRYDTRTETRVTGTVEVVNNLTCSNDYCCCGAGGGTHLTLKTANESVEVHLGPAVWLREQGVDVTAGDTVEILGSRITMRGVPVLWAREIKKGETTWTLHVGQGRPGASPCWR